jgi:hypothetical protein
VLDACGLELQRPLSHRQPGGHVGALHFSGLRLFPYLLLSFRTSYWGVFDNAIKQNERLRIRHLLRRGHCELNASDLADIITTEEPKLTLIANVMKRREAPALKRRDVCSIHGRDGER